MRDDFKNETKNTMALRVGLKCSNPDCRRQTSGPRTESDMSVSIGVAAHIHAASPGGARYDEHMLSTERSDIKNGIWLCQTCSKIIDNDPQRFPAKLLFQWKADAEQIARVEVSSRHPAAEKSEWNTAFLEKRISDVPPARIDLNSDHSLHTNPLDFETIVTRLTIATVRGEPLEIELVHVQLEDFLSKLADAIVREEYRASWKNRRLTMTKAMMIFFSIPVQHLWGDTLDGVAARVTVASEIIKIIGNGGAVDRGAHCKIDVWRTTSPKLNAPIWLSDDELNEVLAKFGFTSETDLALGAGWRAADELPRNIIVNKVFPRIVVELARGNINIEDEIILNLSSWHIGLG